MRLFAGSSALSVLTLDTDSPRAFATLTVIFEDFLEPALATLSLSFMVRLRLIVDGVPLSVTLSLASFGTGTGGVVAVVGAGVGAGAAGVGRRCGRGRRFGDERDQPGLVVVGRHAQVRRDARDRAVEPARQIRIGGRGRRERHHVAFDGHHARLGRLRPWRRRTRSGRRRCRGRPRPGRCTSRRTPSSRGSRPDTRSRPASPPARSRPRRRRRRRRRPRPAAMSWPLVPPFLVSERASVVEPLRIVASAGAAITANAMIAASTPCRAAIFWTLPDAAARFRA